MRYSRITRRNFLKVVGTGSASILLPQMLSCAKRSPNYPNMIVIFCDDLGYGDLGSFGHPTIRTPHLDRMSHEGQKWTNFYVAASVCTPSRSGLLTGRLPIRNGMCSDERRVLFPDSAGGLPESEITLADVVLSVGYRTACIGKWHLGHLPQYLPTRHGFDYYFGIPYSNDMDALAGGGRDRIVKPKSEYFNVPLMRNEEIIERPADQSTLTKRYTEEAVRFIKENKDGPFFLYLAHSMVHVPLFASRTFRGRSLRGIYGDAVEEIDWGVGQILGALQEEGLAKNTLVVFTSDNGPWLLYQQQGGSAGLLRSGKGTTWEGGMRMPTIFWWPGRINPGVVNDMGSTLDLFSTVCHLTGVEVPEDRMMDSENLLPVFFGRGPSPREVFFYYRGTEVYAVRKGPFKLHFITEEAYLKNNNKRYHDPPLLFHLGQDPGEKYDVAKDFPDVIKDIRRELDAHMKKVVAGEDQLARIIEQD